MQLPGLLLIPSSKNLKKSTLKKNSHISGNGTFLPPKEMIKLFKTFSPQKTFIKLFYNLNKTPLGETGCSSNLYYLLATQASSFLIHYPFPNTVS